MGVEQIEYWNSFYEDRLSFRSTSSFCEWVLSLIGENKIVVDFSAGDGTDSIAFLQEHHSVIATEGSITATQLIADRASALNLYCKVVQLKLGGVDGDNSFKIHLNETKRDSKTPVVYYLRFLLHAITEAEEDELFQIISNTAHNKDLIFVEFRNVQASEFYAFGAHYRRVVDPLRIISKLEAIGFGQVDVSLSRSFAPYKGEYPLITRIRGVLEL